MDAHNPDPMSVPHLDELSEVVRLGVEHVRSQLPPADRMHRAVEAARRLGPPPPPHATRHRWALFALTGAIGLALIAYGLQDERFWPSTSDEGTNEGMVHSTEVNVPSQGGRPKFIDVDVEKDAAPPSATPVRLDVEAVSGCDGNSGPCCLYARVRAVLPVIDKLERPANHALFLLDTSKCEPGLALRTKLLQVLLECDRDIQHFDVQPLPVGERWYQPDGWRPNTASARARLQDCLKKLSVDGPTDLASGLERLCAPLPGLMAGAPLQVFLLSDGRCKWETEVSDLVSRLRKHCPYRVQFHCYRTGLGNENETLFESLARNGGGTYNCRAEADVVAAAMAHRWECLRLDRVAFTGGSPTEVLDSDLRVAVPPGGEVQIAARFPQPGRTTLVLEGTFCGRKVSFVHPLEVRALPSGLAARGWRELQSSRGASPIAPEPDAKQP